MDFLKQNPLHKRTYVKMGEEYSDSPPFTALIEPNISLAK